MYLYYLEVPCAVNKWSILALRVSVTAGKVVGIFRAQHAHVVVHAAHGQELSSRHEREMAASQGQSSRKEEDQIHASLQMERDPNTLMAIHDLSVL